MVQLEVKTGLKVNTFRAFQSYPCSATATSLGSSNNSTDSGKNSTEESSVSLIGRVWNEELYKRVRVSPIIETIPKRQLTWLDYAFCRKKHVMAKVFALFTLLYSWKWPKMWQTRCSKTIVPRIHPESPANVQQYTTS